MSENDEDTVSGHGVVKFNPTGGHFYIDSETNYRSPPDDADVATNVMFEWLTDMNKNYGWEVTKEHIKGHEPICEVSWEGPDEYHLDYEFDLPDKLDMDWYSQSLLWGYDEPA